MKKLSFLLVLLSLLVLTACNLRSLDYSSFEENHLDTYSTAETISNNKYVLYYYAEDCESCDTIKSEILSFFDSFEYLDFYLLDSSNSEAGASEFGAFDTEPIVYVVSSNAPMETYTGVSEIREFVLNYSNIEFDYDLFESQHLTSYDEVLNIQNESYILYYYLDSCPHCIATKPDFLPWAFTKSVEDIYFMEGSTVSNPDQLPTELLILNSGTPIVVLMSNGRFADEFYSGKEDVLEYIGNVGNGDIIAEALKPDYSDFADQILDDYSQTLVVSDNVHLEYFYRPTCPFCNRVKDSILGFFDKNPDVEFYIWNTDNSSGVPNFTLEAVPSLYIVANNEIAEEYRGQYEIEFFIEQYNNGSIDFSDYE